MRKLDGRVALITGAGSGIGRATALLFAEEGAKIAVADCASEGGQETVELIKAAGGQAIFVAADVSKAVDVEMMVNITMDTFGRLDILFNNAGVGGLMIPTWDTTEEAWDSVIDINLKGVFLGSKYALPVMISQGGGVIINTASITAIVGAPGLPAYCASKGGVAQLTKTIALESAKHNIRVNCICPGMIQTAMSDSPFLADAADRQAHIQAFLETIPLGRLGRPEDIAKTALFLASDDSSYMTGAALVVDGGRTAR